MPWRATWFLTACLVTQVLGSVQVSTNVPTFQWDVTASNASSWSFQLVLRHQNSTVIWDTGKVVREQQELFNGGAVTYSGPPLERLQQYSWSVNRNGVATGHGRFTTAPDLAPARTQALLSTGAVKGTPNNITALFEGTLANLRGRINSTDGFMNTSVGGGYTGMYTRDSSVAIFAFLRAGEIMSARAVLLWMLRTFSVCELDRAPHCTWKAWRTPVGQWYNCTEADVSYAWGVHDFHDQLDGTMHFVVAFTEFIKATQDTNLAATYYPLIMRFMSTYVGNATYGNRTSYLNSTMSLYWNPGFEGPGGSSYNLLSNLFLIKAVKAAGWLASTVARDSSLAAYFNSIAPRVLLGIRTWLTRDGIYASHREFSSPNQLVWGLNWDNMSPAAILLLEYTQEPTSDVDLDLLKATLSTYRKLANFRFATPSFGADVPLTSVDPIKHAGQELAVIGKGLAWEMFASAKLRQWNRVTELFEWLSGVAGNVTLFGESYFYQPYIEGKPYWGDIGNAEQASWFVLAVLKVREILEHDHD